MWGRTHLVLPHIGMASTFFFFAFFDAFLICLARAFRPGGHPYQTRRDNPAIRGVATPIKEG